MRVNDQGNIISNLIRALTNRLTAEDNFGPEGRKWFVLTCRGPKVTDPPPAYLDIREVISNTLTEIPELPGDDGDGLGLQGPPGPQGEPGPAGPEGPEGPAGFVPTYIAPTETFTVPANKQALFALPIDTEGEMDIQGELVQVPLAGGGETFGDVDGGEPDSVYGGMFVIDGGGI